MRAIVCTKYGTPEVLALQDVERPEPKGNEVRVKVHATTVHVGDTRIRAFRVPTAAWLFARLALGVRRPKHPILGMEAAGVVDALGERVSMFRVGDEVMAFAGFRFGAYAEYLCVPLEGNPAKVGMVVRKPEGVSFEQAAPLTGGAITALLVLREADIQAGQKVLVYGASGSVGTYAVQLAKGHFGAEVTAVCSGGNVELVAGLGADRVIDYTKEDVSAGEERYDVVFDAVDKLPAKAGKKLLKPGGTYLNVDRSSNGLTITTEDLVFLGELAAEGKVVSVIDRRYPMDEIVEAHRYVDQGHKKGNVIVSVAAAEETDTNK